MTAATGNELRLDFLPSKAESTLERCAMLGLQHVASEDEVLTEKQRLAAEWQRHQLVPATPTPAMRYYGDRFLAVRTRRRRFRDSVREAVSGVLGTIATRFSPPVTWNASANPFSNANPVDPPQRGENGGLQRPASLPEGLAALAALWSARAAQPSVPSTDSSPISPSMKCGDPRSPKEPRSTSQSPSPAPSPVMLKRKTMSTTAIDALGRKTIQTASCNTIASDTTTASLNPDGADTSLDCFEDLRWLNRLPPDWD